MLITLREFQKKVLELLLDKYEDSKTYAGENRVSQSFSVLPSKVFGSYDSDYEDVDLVRDFESQMEELERERLLEIRRGSRGLEKLVAIPECWQVYYVLLQREDKHTLQQKQKEMYQSFLGIHPILDSFCQEQNQRLDDNKKAMYSYEEAEWILKLCKVILTNQQEILERELSIVVLKDSKLWEQKFRSSVCSLLRRFGNYEELLLGVTVGEDKEDKREVERILLAEHLVFSNPSYVYFKGNATFLFVDGSKLEVCDDMPLAFSTDMIKRLEKVQIFDAQVMTVENLTSFNRMKREGSFLIFLSGYHNSAKQKLIRKIYEENSNLQWKHFGDIDPDGFYILEHLRQGTEIDFEPMYMNCDYLVKYKDYTKRLTNNDRKKAERLLQEGKYCDVMKYMLDKGVKLEQEIISWMED